MGLIGDYLSGLDNVVAKSPVGYYFHLEGSGHPREIRNSRFTTELRAGLTTFFTMAYIIAVNAAIITDSGATCVCNSTADDPVCDTNTEYQLCLLVVNRDIITGTAAIASLASFFMGLCANLPVALAPGMGLNAYLAYQVVGYHGTGSIPYSIAMTAVFVEGFIFLVLSALGLRQWLARIIPVSIRVACGAGIGLFLTLIGLTYSAGLGAITGGTSTPLDLAGCPEAYLDPITGQCSSHKLRNPRLWIGYVFGGLLTAYLMMYKVKSSMIIGIAIVSIISWPRDTSFTYFPKTPIGSARFDFFKQVVAFHPIQKTLAVQQWDLSKVGGEFALALITFLYVDILDCTGTLYSMARFSGVVDPDTGDFPRSTLAYCTDAVAVTIGSLFGSSPVTAYVESGAGIQEGGRTGLTAMTTGICFFISIFFAPIFASIPPWATGGALVLVGCMMLKGVLAINWSYVGDAIPAFVTLMFMPFSYSIAYGLIAGLLTYTIINGAAYLMKLITRGYIVPEDEDSREYWSLRGGDRSVSPWFIRAIKGEKKFWLPPAHEVFELQSNPDGTKGHKESA